MVMSSHLQLNLITEVFSRLCIKTPRKGSRLLKTGDEDLLEFTKHNVSDWCFGLLYPLMFAEVEIPVIVVLTKYDLLVMDHYRACRGMPEGEVEAKKRAEHALSEVTKELKELEVLYAPVSTQKR